MTTTVPDMTPSGYPLTRETSDESTASSEVSFTAHARPSLIRRETDQILSYYQSEHAGRSYDHYCDPVDEKPALKRKDSNSSSEYSADSYNVHPLEKTSSSDSTQTEATIDSHHTRRPSAHSQENADRRRLAVVELNTSIPPSISRKGKSDSKGRGGSESALPSALLTRRGLDVNGLVLVAPPDALPSTYTDLTPPPTAPVAIGHRFASSISPVVVHSRSASDTVGSSVKRKTSRDIGIIGAGKIPTIFERSGVNSHYGAQAYSPNTSLQAPIFQTPHKSRPSSPAYYTPNETVDPTMNSYNGRHTHSMSLGLSMAHDPMHTPAIGEGKDIRQPVVGPVVVGIDSARILQPGTIWPPQITSSSSLSSNSSSPPASSYLYYQPGVHSTAGPLPPPPMSFLDPKGPTPSDPPPRPPRRSTPLDSSSSSKPHVDSLKSSLRLPEPISTTLVSRSQPDITRTNTDVSIQSAYTDVSSRSDLERVGEAKRSKSIHRREGAFPPSATTPDSSPSLDDVLSAHDERVKQVKNEPPPVRLVTTQPLSADDDSDRRPGIELRREASWMSLRQERHVSGSPKGARSHSVEQHSLRSSASNSSIGTGSLSPPVPPKLGQNSHSDDVTTAPSASTNRFKAAVTNLKRFSALPRAPSSLSMNSTKHTTTLINPRTPSPYQTSPRPPSSKLKIISQSPDAMQFRDVLSMKSAVERSRGYADKINELARYDTGLSMWMSLSRCRGSGTQSVKSSLPKLVPGTGPSLPSTLIQNNETRHASHGSISSQMTFPVRADAYTATDLSTREEDDLAAAKTIPSALPYPSLASVSSPPTRSNTTLSSLRTYQIPLSNGSKSTGFFSSIGKKNSLKEKGPPSPTRVLTKRNPNVQPLPRSVQSNTTPHVPGGPRAAPGRMQRSQTISVAPAPPPQPIAPQLARSETTATYRQSQVSRRGSFLHRSTTAVVPVSTSIPDFEQQVDKLCDLLPHANRSILAGYLRRAGQDILAIGQYLEDEKTGNIRYDK